jgi:site-specific recombinase XerD
VDAPTSDKIVWHACRVAAQRAGITKRVHPHTLRHYATSRTMLPRRTGAAFCGLSNQIDVA